MNKRVFWIALILILTAAGMAAVKVMRPQTGALQAGDGKLRSCLIRVAVQGKGGPVRIKMLMPKKNERQTIYNEHMDHEGFQMQTSVRKPTENLMVAWRAGVLEGLHVIQYSFACHLREKRYEIDPTAKIAENPSVDYPHEMQVWLNASKYIQSGDPIVRQTLWRITNRSRETKKVVGNIFAFVRGEIHYQSEKMSKDAKATLGTLEANCGGKARLFCALSRAAGIPSRLVGGIIMDVGQKNITHVWAENYIDGQWIPFDVVNNYFAMVPDHYLEIYRGDAPLFRFFGTDKIDYSFTIKRGHTRPVKRPWSLYILPAKIHHFVHFLLLIPVGALVIAFARTIIGIPTFGTFAPILLAAAFREVSVVAGLVCLAVILGSGLILRLALDKLHILGIPRLSIILTAVVTTVLLIFVVSVRFSQDKVLYFSFFPMIIMTWMIERFSVAQIEDGFFSAFKSAAGTALLATVLYFVYGIPTLRQYLFQFPEMLLAIMGILLLLGRYTGYRLLELIRFKDMHE